MLNPKLFAACLLGLLLACAAASAAEECCDPVSPFRPGEGYAEKPATCANAGFWLERAPAADERISMTIRGELSAVDTNGTLAYLVMCEAPDTRILCVTYETGGYEPGDVVIFGGGFEATEDKRIILDPCLASPE